MENVYVYIWTDGVTLMRVVTVSVNMLEYADNRICAVHFGKEALVKYAVYAEQISESINQPTKIQCHLHK